MAGGLTRDARKAETRDALLRAAARLFAREGIEATSLERIAAEHGLSKGAVYAHFASKKELVAAVLDAFESDPALEPLRSAYADDTRPFAARMRDVGRIGAELTERGIFGLSGVESVLLDLESVLYALRNRDPAVAGSAQELIEASGEEMDEAQRARGEPLARPGVELRLLLYNLFRGLMLAHAQSPEVVTGEGFEDAFTTVATALATQASTTHH
jgi:AcrR family transcriptional regulator